jgi:hypothetical protein
MVEIHSRDAEALKRNGWRLIGPGSARRDYPGGISAVITAAGHWEVQGPQHGASRSIMDGNEPTVICAAMEANERAWSQPEYLEASQADRRRKLGFGTLAGA